jgi:ATP-dependent DNA ligase
VHSGPRLKAPVGPQWIHEIKHDGYRLIVRKQGDRARLFTRRVYDWTARYPLIATAAAKLRASSAVLDGEAACAYETPRSLISRTASSLNSRVNRRLSMTHLQLHQNT